MNCKEVGRLISEGLDRDLSLFQRMHLRMHLALCVMCRRVSRQFSFLRVMAQRLGDLNFEATHDDGMFRDRGLPPDAKSRIKARLERR